MGAACSFFNFWVMGCRPSSAAELHSGINQFLHFISFARSLFNSRRQKQPINHKLKVDGIEWMEMSLLASKPITNNPQPTIFDCWVKGQQTIHFIHQFHSTKKKSKLSFLFSFHWFTCELIGMKLKKYYNSTVIRAGIYLLSAIMKNFVLNYERQLVDDCDNNERRPFNTAKAISSRSS